MALKSIIGSMVDEIFVASTDAALNHLQYLQKFGDWRLAVAAYDAGEGRVKRALKEAKNSSISPIDINIPQETSAMWLNYWHSNQ